MFGDAFQTPLSMCIGFRKTECLSLLLASAAVIRLCAIGTVDADQLWKI